MQTALHILKTDCETMKLSVNTTKTKVMTKLEVSK